MERLIKKIVNNCKVIDVHTHLFPYEHGELFLYGIDSLLTYHYLIAELFIFYKDISIEIFYKLSKKQQADIIWEQLFILKSPISEACRGVLTVCKKLGLEKAVKNKDLNEIRKFFDNLNSDPEILKNYITEIFKMANVEYTIMTNQIFNNKEIHYWSTIESTNIPEEFKTSLRIDELLFNYDNCLKFIQQYNYPPTDDGLKDYIKYWYKKLKPQYFMASLPSDFSFHLEECKDIVFRMNYTNVIDLFLVPLAIELKLPIAFKFGTQRGMNKRLGDAGDGLGVAYVESLSNLCRLYPNCKFLATFLSKENQHQLCVAARNFPNLHIYGCWWYLNNPSLIEEITNMRIEMLGLGFTFQHSDSRVIEQLLYKWDHSKKILIEILIKKYKEMRETGWDLKEEDIIRDVNLLLRGSFENFINLNKKNPSQKLIKS